MATNNTYIYGSFLYEVQTIPQELPKVESRALNRGIYRTWVESKREERVDQEILKAVEKHIRHVSYSTFKTSLRSCVTKFREKAPSRYIAFVEPGKSQT